MTAASDNHMTSSVSILDEELRSKIEENARLHKQVKRGSLKCSYGYGSYWMAEVSALSD